MNHGWVSRARRIKLHNVTTLRSRPLAEVSGSLGDLGTLLPLMIALAVQGSIDLGSTLVFSGLWNVLTGIFFGIPLPVQPMKAISASAISGRGNSDMGVVAAAGQWVSIAVLIMSITGILRWVVSHVPVPVVKGIQLGAGLSLVLSAGSSLLQPLAWLHPILDNRLWAILAFLVLIGTQHLPRFPYALSFFILGLLFAIIELLTSGGGSPSLQLWRPHFMIPAWLSHHQSAVWMAIGQLPLTTLNSVIAVSALSAELLPDLPTPSVTSIGMSVAIMNLVGTWFGAMPVCHGAGGLAAQYRFGARSGSSVVMLGVFKMIVGFFFGESLLSLLSRYPNSILGIMVLAAGLELAKVGNSLNQGASDLWQVASRQDHEHLPHARRMRDLDDDERLERWNVMLMTTAGILAFRNDAVGFAAGMLCHWAYRLCDFLAKGQRSRATASNERGPLLR